MKHYGALEIFHFDHNSVLGNETTRSKEDIQPEDDPALSVFWPGGQQVNTNPISVAEIKAFMDVHEPARTDHLVELCEHGLI